MKHVYKYTTFVLIAVIALMSYFLLVRGNIRALPDHRTGIVVDEGGKAYILNEMNVFIAAIAEINFALSENNYNTIQSVAKRSGTLSRESIPADLLKVLPLHYKNIAFATNENFDKIATMAIEFKPPGEIQKEIHALMQGCLSCHSSYRLALH
jgi:hypothetical protein